MEFGFTVYINRKGMSKINLTGKTVSELEQFAVEIGEKPFRGRQLFTWMYAKGVRDFSVMTDMSKNLRTKLQEAARIGVLKPAQVITSEQSTARKYAFELSDGEIIESVYIPEGSRRTLCVSSQVGCSLNCAFCATGKLGFIRDLTVAEIVDQVLYVENDIGVEITNLVFMGMGEPLLNYENVLAACELIGHEKGIAISPRRIVVSTAGIIPAIVRLADEGVRYRLAISLNATTNDLRLKLMPIAKKYPLGELLNSVKYYYNKIKRRPTFEYVLISGVNDREEDAKRLRSLLRTIPCKINLIPYNAVDEKFHAPSDAQIEHFRALLEPLRAPVIIRWSKGRDIQAACGQLAGAKKNKSVEL